MRTKQNQSTFDIATQSRGDVKSVLAFCLENDFSLASDLPAGSVVKIPESQYIDEDALSVYRSRGIELATGAGQIPSDGIGIGWMIIETNFDVT